jgi:ABC-type methionine transport system ATPase subunit
LKLLIDAESAQDNAQAAKVKAKTSRDVDNYAFALADMSKLAADPALKRALADMSQQVSVLKGDVRKLDAKKLAALRTTLDSACRK